jgi:integrase
MSSTGKHAEVFQEQSEARVRLIIKSFVAHTPASGSTRLTSCSRLRPSVQDVTNRLNPVWTEIQGLRSICRARRIRCKLQDESEQRCSPFPISTLAPQEQIHRPSAQTADSSGRTRHQAVILDSIFVRSTNSHEREKNLKFDTNLRLNSFTGKELDAMRSHSEGDRLLFLLLRWTGLRASDAIGLTWGDLSLDQRQIEYVQHKNPRKRKLRPIHDELLSALRTEHQRRNPRQNEHVLQDANGKPFTREYVRRRIMAIGRRSGVPYAYPYRLRHTFAVDLLLRGFAPCCVARLLGHETETAMRHYLPYVREHLETARGPKEEGGPVMRLRRRAGIWHVGLLRNGVHMVRGSLGTRNSGTANKLARALEDALAEGPKSILWSHLRHTIPGSTFSRFARLAGVQECSANRKPATSDN